MSLKIIALDAKNPLLNYIWVLVNETQKQAIVVDPTLAQPVQDYLIQHQLVLQAVWITHDHFDHIGGLAELREHYPTATVYAHKKLNMVDSQPMQLQDASQFMVWGMPVTVWQLEGHKPYHLAYLLHDTDNCQQHVFCGDMLFSGGCGRVFMGDYAVFFNSLKRLAHLPDDTLLYPSHEYTASNLRFGLSIEPNNLAMQYTLTNVEQNLAKGIPSLPVSLAHERQINPFLRVHEPSVITGIKQQVVLSDEAPLTVFTALRQLKDNF